MALSHVTGKMVHHDGTETEFIINDMGYRQWGAARDKLGENVGALQALAAAADFFISSEAEEEDDEDA